MQNVSEETDCEDDENLRVLTFARTPIMSTYLLAFVVGEFDYVEAHTEDGILVRVYTPLGKAEQGQFALEVWRTLLCLKDAVLYLTLNLRWRYGERSSV